MTNTERQRLAAILGMLGSNSAGERDNAATQVERMRHRLGKTWEELLSNRVVFVDSFIPPWPQQKQTVVQEPPETGREKTLGMPWWAFAAWCVTIGFLLG